MTALPAASDITGASQTQAQAKTWFTNIRDWASGLFGTDGTAATARTALGSSSVGDQVFVAADAATARTAIGAEASASKATSFATVNNTLYPTVQAVKTYADALVVGLLDDRGSFDASGNAWPTTGGSGTAGAIMKGDLWYISVAGTLGGTAVAVNDSIRALVDTPGSTAANWDILPGTSSVASQTHAATSKATPVDADELPLVDSAASNVLKKLTWANLKATLKTYFDSLTTTLTNKRITARVVTVASTSTAPVDGDSTDIYTITELAAACVFAAPTGTPTEGQLLEYIILDNGTARALSFNAIFVARGIALPTTTVLSKYLRMMFEYNATATKWDLIGTAQEA